MTDPARCDFCSDPCPIWRYPARDATQQPAGVPGFRDLVSVGDWAACEQCAQLIEQERLSLLASLAAARLRLRGVPATARGVKEQHQLYWRNRILERDRRPYVALPTDE